MMTRVRRGLLVAMLFIAVVPSQAHASTQTITIYGSFVLTSCAPTKVAPGNPQTTILVTCMSTSELNGAFVGVDSAKVTGSIDVVSGDGSASSDEWFYGVYDPGGLDRLPGGLHLKGTQTVEGDTGGFAEAATIVGGTCGFVGSSGTARFYGTLAGGATGYGGYTVTWTRPSPPPPFVPGCNPITSLPVP
jgi:hypothetical protein